MKQLVIVAFAMIAVAAFAPATFALEDDGSAGASAIVNVSVNVNPLISVTPGPELAGGTTIQYGSVGQGNFAILVPFSVNANSQELILQVNASNLYKADDPTTSNYIPVNLSAGAIVSSPTGQASPIKFGSTQLPYTGTSTVGGFPTVMTSAVEYQSSQAGVFSQEIDVTVTWNTTANPILGSELPTGEYSGVVQLIATILPTTS
jgi:hypothetical protein